MREMPLYLAVVSSQALRCYRSPHSPSCMHLFQEPNLLAARMEAAADKNTVDTAALYGINEVESDTYGQ